MAITFVHSLSVRCERDRGGGSVTSAHVAAPGAATCADVTEPPPPTHSLERHVKTARVSLASRVFIGSLKRKTLYFFA